MKRSTNLLKLTAAFTICGGLLFSSCKKDNSATGEESQAMATLEASGDDAQAEEQFDDVFNITMGVKSADVGEDIGLGDGIGLYGSAMLAGTGDRTSSPDSIRCFTVTVTPLALHQFPKTVTTNFGTGCLGRDGKLRKGKIVTVYTGPMFVPGKKATTTFVDYFVDSFKIEGTHSVENTSSQSQAGFSVKVVNGKITNTVANRWRKWDSEKNILQTEGNGTPQFPLDDIFKITGNAHGSNSQAHVWTSVITEPLVKKFICRWIVKGKVNITRDGNLAVLDYGTGNCDNQAVITINGVSHTITLH